MNLLRKTAFHGASYAFNLRKPRGRRKPVRGGPPRKDYAVSTIKAAVPDTVATIRGDERTFTLQIDAADAHSAR